MTTPVRLELEEPGTIEEIPIGCVCSNARFVFDQPVTLLSQNHIELREGQFWLVEGAFEFLLEGKWSL